jgi:hypothetical protein
MPIPFLRQLRHHAHLGWYVLIWFIIFGLLLTYIGFITASAARGFQLRDAETRIERLQSEARTLETKVAALSSVAAMRKLAGDMGFVAMDRVESVNVLGHSYALAPSPGL